MQCIFILLGIRGREIKERVLRAHHLISLSRCFVGSICLTFKDCDSLLFSTTTTKS